MTVEVDETTNSSKRTISEVDSAVAVTKLTEGEKCVMLYLLLAWGAYDDLPESRPGAQSEFAQLIYTAQRLMLCPHE